MQYTPISLTSIPGRYFCFTGALSVTRERAREFIHTHGGWCNNTITSQTDYLVVGDRPGSKLNDASSRGVKLVSASNFEDLFNHPFAKSMANEKANEKNEKPIGYILFPSLIPAQHFGQVNKGKFQISVQIELDLLDSLRSMGIYDLEDEYIQEHIVPRLEKALRKNPKTKNMHIVRPLTKSYSPAKDYFFITFLLQEDLT